MRPTDRSNCSRVAFTTGHRLASQLPPNLAQAKLQVPFASESECLFAIGKCGKAPNYLTGFFKMCGGRVEKVEAGKNLWAARRMLRPPVTTSDGLLLFEPSGRGLALGM